jgi:hypothetical protein
VASALSLVAEAVAAASRVEVVDNIDLVFFSPRAYFRRYLHTFVVAHNRLK